MSIDQGWRPGVRRVTALGLLPVGVGPSGVVGLRAVEVMQVCFRRRNRATAMLLRSMHAAGRATAGESLNDELDPFSGDEVAAGLGWSRSMILPTAVEELLRVDGPIKLLVRWVLAEHDLGGHTISAGERVYLVLVAANHDPATFDRADEVDLTRSPNPHIAFGKGIYACIGAQLARLETRAAVGTLGRRLPGLRFADEEVSWNPASPPAH